MRPRSLIPLAVEDVAPGGLIVLNTLGVNDLGEIVGDYIGAGGEMFGFLDNGGGLPDSQFNCSS
jgi:hypothetical protein